MKTNKRTSFRKSEGKYLSGTSNSEIDTSQVNLSSTQKHSIAKHVDISIENAKSD